MDNTYPRDNGMQVLFRACSFEHVFCCVVVKVLPDKCRGTS